MSKKIYFLFALTFVLTPTIYCGNKAEDKASQANLAELEKLLEKMNEPKEARPDLGEVELNLREKLHFFWMLDRGEKWRQIKERSNGNWTSVKEYVSNNKMLCTLAGLSTLQTILLLTILRDLRRDRPYVRVFP